MINVSYEDMPREIEALLGEIEQLEQENRQLKEALENLEIINAERSNLIVEDMKELVKYKSVLDKIREQTKSGITSYNYGGSRTSLFEVLVAINEILDKVGIE